MLQLSKLIINFQHLFLFMCDNGIKVSLVKLNPNFRDYKIGQNVIFCVCVDVDVNVINLEMYELC